MDNLLPIEGSPLIPRYFFTIYIFIIFFLNLIYFIFTKSGQKKLTIFRQKRKLFLFNFICHFFLVLFIATVTGFILVPKPKIVMTVPDYNNRTIGKNSAIEFVFDRPLVRKKLLKTINPDTPGVFIYKDPLYATHLYRRLVFYPQFSLKSDSDYEIKLSGISNFLQITKPSTFNFSFKTQKLPEIIKTEYSKNNKPIIEVNLDKANDDLAQFDFEIIPYVPININLNIAKNSYTLIPAKPLGNANQYTLNIKKTEISRDNINNKITAFGESETVWREAIPWEQVLGFENLNRQNTEIINSPSIPRISGTFPEDGWTGIDAGNSVKISFESDMDKKTAEERFSIDPPVEGTFTWDGNDLIFKPKNNFSFSTQYKVTVEKGFSNSQGMESPEMHSFTFTTSDETIKLKVPQYLQKYALSCEAAALRMALAYRGVEVEEDEILEQIHKDPTGKSGNIWGNPYVGFVGKVSGKQMVNGYGVYWDPVKNAANKFRSAVSFEGWTIEKLTESILKNNPVIIWGYVKGGQPANWYTPGNDLIKAIADEHTLVVTGFRGPANNPSYLIVNDPLTGEKYLQRGDFEKKWSAFNRSGVVVY